VLQVRAHYRSKSLPPAATVAAQHPEIRTSSVPFWGVTRRLRAPFFELVAMGSALPMWL